MREIAGDPVNIGPGKIDTLCSMSAHATEADEKDIERLEYSEEAGSWEGQQGGLKQAAYRYIKGRRKHFTRTDSRLHLSSGEVKRRATP